ncbi:MotA/TolQ/ExbB proton channel family protein [Diaphorobacter sp.]|uniref:MotA/TolQ/ExbB proton channel family protein n=1 Tax=Diaphorobacter sp. TaxID=1934310 RepID=UPI0028AE3020|nr:MotA/TolQ/ExbB proton channel family protein [Diaphorobacter sp.]
MDIKTLVEYAVFGLLGLLSVTAVAVALERRRFYGRVKAVGYTSRARLENDLTRRLNIIGTVAANAPFIGLLGTVLGIMLTFESLGASGQMDVKSIMTGLALALKATAAGIAVAIPCVMLNNWLRQHVRARLTDFDEAHGS